MSDVATFEFQTSVDLCSIQQKAAKHWTGKGRNVDVYIWKNPVRAFCVLEYFYGELEEREMLCKVAKYLLKVATDNSICYYRCIDSVGLLAPQNYLNPEKVAHCQPIEISVDDLLLDPYQPNMQARSIEKFVIKLRKNSGQVTL